jgi:hypothetical protein
MTDIDTLSNTGRTLDGDGRIGMIMDNGDEKWILFDRGQLALDVFRNDVETYSPTL